MSSAGAVPRRSATDPKECICEFCGSDFFANPRRGPWPKWCSVACKSRAFRRRRGNPVPEHKVAEYYCCTRCSTWYDAVQPCPNCPDHIDVVIDGRLRRVVTQK